MTRISGIRAAFACITLCAAGAVQATGFYVNQQSVVGMGRVNAGAAAAADDPATLVFNPAALVSFWDERRLRGHRHVFAAGAQTLIPRTDLANAGSFASTPGTLGAAVPYPGANVSDPGDPTPLPNLFYTRRLGADAAAGIAITAPFGLASEYPADWFGRYDATEASLLTLNFGVAGALRLSRTLSVGGGLDVQYADAKLVSAVPNPLAPGGPTPATDARAQTDGDAWTPGFNIGVLWTPRDGTRVGVHYRSHIRHEIEGVAQTSGFTGALAGANGSVGARARLRLPAIASLALAQRLSALTTLYGQLEWYRWSDFDAIRIRFDDGRSDVVRVANYRDTWAAALGADYRVSDDFTVRGGVRYDRTPTRDGFRDTTLPDGDRFWVSAGATLRFDDQWRVDVALIHAFIDRARIDITRTFFDNTPLASSARVLGNTSSTSVTTVSFNVGRAF